MNGQFAVLIFRALGDFHAVGAALLEFAGDLTVDRLHAQTTHDMITVMSLGIRYLLQAPCLLAHPGPFLTGQARERGHEFPDTRGVGAHVAPSHPGDGAQGQAAAAFHRGFALWHEVTYARNSG